MMVSRTTPRPARRALLAGLALALGVVGLSSCRVAPERVTVTPVLTGLNRPWDIAFTPGQGMLFSERVGRLRFRKAVAPFEVVNFGVPADLVASYEAGMLGIAVDPNFSTNRRVYACFQSNRSGALDMRVVRWRMNDAVTALTERTDIVTGIPSGGGRNAGCRPRFGPDGYLWIGTGDAYTATAPQSRTSLGGKVLRVDTNGRGAPGNAPAPFDPRIYSYGHRNVQGIAFSLGGKAYAIEHGTDREDEVNRLFAGANYGWDPRPPGGGTTYDGTRPMTDRTRYPAARLPAWSSGSRTIAPSGGTFISGPEKWKGWHGTLAMAVLKDNELRIVAFDTDGMKAIQQWVPITAWGRLRTVVRGPGGDLYAATDADNGQIIRISAPT